MRIQIPDLADALSALRRMEVKNDLVGAPKITSAITGRAIKLYINGALHLCIRRGTLLGFQSWIEGETSPMYKIEYYTAGAAILTEYDSMEKWSAILKLLDGLYW